jgi:hypothetical protein
MAFGLKSAWLVVALCLVAADASAIGGGDYDANNPMDRFVFDVFVDKPLAGEIGGTSLKRLEKKLGAPGRVTQKTRDFRNHQGAVEYRYTAYTLVYPDLTLVVGSIAGTPLGIDSMLITGPGYQLAGDLHLGMSLAAFQKVLGKDNLMPIGTSGREYEVSDDCLFAEQGVERAYDVKLTTDKAGRVISLSWASAEPDGY